ncbi:MAG: hypothetical protein GXO85_10585 [Chlorobi bacterium]|nr:hypothetical protein [Chlorobiota bacterium]
MGAASLTYTLVAGDSGASITFEVTPVAAAGSKTGNALTSAGILVVNSTPVANAVGITDNNGGDAIIGDTLTGFYTYNTYNDADDDIEGTSTFRWLRDGDGVAISGATSLSYTLVSGDIPCLYYI